MMQTEDTVEKDLDKMITQVSEDIESYVNKYVDLKTKHAKTLEDVDGLISPEKPSAALRRENKVTKQNAKDSQRYRIKTDLFG